MKQAVETIALWTFFCALVFVLGAGDVVAENQPPVQKAVLNFCALDFDSGLLEGARDMMCKADNS